MAQAPAQRNKFADLDLDFDLNPVNGDVVKKIDLEAIKRSVRNLVRTGKYERLFHPEINCGIGKTLFENMSVGAKLRVQTFIKETVSSFEPRVQVSSVNVTETIDGHGLNVTLSYTIDNRPEPFKLSFEVTS